MFPGPPTTNQLLSFINAITSAMTSAPGHISAGNRVNACGAPGMILTIAAPPAICHFALMKMVSSRRQSAVPQTKMAGGIFAGSGRVEKLK